MENKPQTSSEVILPAASANTSEIQPQTSISIVEQSETIVDEQTPEEKTNFVLSLLRKSKLRLRNFRKKLETEEDFDNYCKSYNSLPKNIKINKNYEIDMEPFPAGNITPESIINNLRLRLPDALRTEIRESIPDLSSTDCKLFFEDTLTKRGTLVLGERLGTPLSDKIVDLLVKSPKSPEVIKAFNSALYSQISVYSLTTVVNQGPLSPKAGFGLKPFKKASTSISNVWSAFPRTPSLGRTRVNSPRVNSRRNSFSGRLTPPLDINDGTPLNTASLASNDGTARSGRFSRWTNRIAVRKRKLSLFLSKRVSKYRSVPEAYKHNVSGDIKELSEFLESPIEDKTLKGCKKYISKMDSKQKRDTRSFFTFAKTFMRLEIKSMQTCFYVLK